jgi:hypothetical protein
MTTWLLNAELESEPGTFECDPELDVGNGDTVFVREPDDDTIVGEFDVLDARALPGGEAEEVKEIRLTPRTEEIFRVTDTQAIDSATERKLRDGELRFLRRVNSTENEMWSRSPQTRSLATGMGQKRRATARQN